MEKLFRFIKEWASVIIVAVIVALLLCAFIVCVTQLSAKIGVFLSSAGALGCGLSLLVLGYGLVYEINSRRAR